MGIGLSPRRHDPALYVGSVSSVGPFGALEQLVEEGDPLWLLMVSNTETSVRSGLM
jgi:hypothetical protein